MKKKLVVLVGFCLLVSFEVFSDSMYYDGDMLVSISYVGIRNTSEAFSILNRMGELIDAKPSYQQLEVAKRALNRYDTRQGEVYRIDLKPRNSPSGFFYIFVCEFTSSSNFNYWFYRLWMY